MKSQLNKIELLTRPEFVQATHCVVKQGVPRLITHLQHLLTGDMVQELGDQVEVVGSFKKKHRFSFVCIYLKYSCKALELKFRLQIREGPMQ